MTFERIPSKGRRPALAGRAGVVAGLAPAQPASAQYWGGGDRYYGGGYGGYRNYRQSPPRDYFFPFSGFMRPPPVVDSTKAPASRKLEAPTTSTVVVVGD